MAAWLVSLTPSIHSMVSTLWHVAAAHTGTRGQQAHSHSHPEHKSASQVRRVHIHTDLLRADTRASTRTRTRETRHMPFCTRPRTLQPPPLLTSGWCAASRSWVCARGAWSRTAPGSARSCGPPVCVCVCGVRGGWVGYVHFVPRRREGVDWEEG